MTKLKVIFFLEFGEMSRLRDYVSTERSHMYYKEYLCEIPKL